MWNRRRAALSSARSPTVRCGLAVRRKIVVAIRGTLSVQDCMTDCIADDESLDELGLAGEFAHDGMYNSARNIERDLAEHNLLSLLLSDGKVPAGKSELL